MSERRKLIFKTLGLTPVWRLRAGIPDAQAPEVITGNDSPAADVSTQASFSAEYSEAAIRQMNWEQLAETVKNCTACPLRKTCTQTVFGVGDKNADWLYIGEGPGAREDELGEPFVGQAGKLLDNMLAAIHLRRGDNVYITNIVKCRPPNNRNPSDSEARQCEPYLARQIALIKPKLIIALGKVAAQNLLNSDDSIASLRGRVHQYSGIPLIVTYHPAYLLRALHEKAKAWKDLCRACELMDTL
ncbi:MAG: uracil-DNA glycosylase [Nitrosomonas sp.]|nr:uracil-DNA glycosylase [Nitrosomonas sp.]